MPIVVKQVLLRDEVSTDDSVDEGHADVVSPMPGRIVKLFHKKGDHVEKGANLVAVESMKMEYFVKATQSGVVDNVMIAEGDAVQLKQKLVSLKAHE